MSGLYRKIIGSLLRKDAYRFSYSDWISASRTACSNESGLQQDFLEVRDRCVLELFSGGLVYVSRSTKERYKLVRSHRRLWRYLKEASDINVSMRFYSVALGAVVDMNYPDDFCITVFGEEDGIRRTAEFFRGREFHESGYRRCVKGRDAVLRALNHEICLFSFDSAWDGSESIDLDVAFVREMTRLVNLGCFDLVERFLSGGINKRIYFFSHGNQMLLSFRQGKVGLEFDEAVS